MRKALIQRSNRGRQSSIVRSHPAPVKGWNTRDPIAAMDPQYAVRLENWWPNASDVSVRKGSFPHLTGVSGNVLSLMGYNSALASKLFAVTDSGIFDSSTAGSVGSSLLAVTNGKLQHTNFTVAGGDYMVAVNGNDNLMLYDGTSWANITGVSSPAITGIDTADLIHVNVFKERLWFVEKDSTSAWYLPVKQIGGALTEFPLGQIFSRGGYLMAMATWSIDTGIGPDDYAVFISSEGEVAVYQGTDPSSIDTFAIVGRYYVAPPIGRRCICDFGGDTALVTTAGLFPLSQALLNSKMDYRAALSDTVAPTFQASAEVYGANYGWQPILVPHENMLLVNIPTLEGYYSVQMAMNTITRAWTLFTNLNAFCWEVWQGRVFFGAREKVMEAFSGYNDSDGAVTAIARTAFNYFGSSNVKHAKLIRPIFTSDGSFSADFGIDVDFENIDNTSTIDVSSTSQYAWDDAIWDSALWSADFSVQKSWRTVFSNEGFCLSVRLRIAAQNVNVKWNSTDIAFQAGGVL